MKDQQSAEFQANVGVLMQPFRTHPGKGATKSVFPPEQYSNILVPGVLFFPLKPDDGTKTGIQAAMVIGSNDDLMGVREMIFPYPVTLSIFGENVVAGVNPESGYKYNLSQVFFPPKPKATINDFVPRYLKAMQDQQVALMNIGTNPAGFGAAVNQLLTLQMDVLAAGFTWAELVKAAGAGSVLTGQVGKLAEAAPSEKTDSNQAVGRAFTLNVDINQSSTSQPAPNPFSSGAGAVSIPVPPAPRVKPLIPSRFPPIAPDPNAVYGSPEYWDDIMSRSQKLLADHTYRVALRILNLKIQNWEWTKYLTGRAPGPYPSLDPNTIYQARVQANLTDDIMWAMIESDFWEASSFYDDPTKVYDEWTGKNAEPAPAE